MALNLFFSLPNKLDSLEKIQTWYSGKMKINPYLSDRSLAINQRTPKGT